jgi:HK97 family phage major capsid protein
MSWEKSKELRAERAALVKQAQEILSKKDRTKEDNEKFDALMAAADEKMVDIERFERAIKAQQDLNARIDSRAGREDITISASKDKEESNKREMDIFLKWCAFGMSELTGEEKQFMAGRRAEIPGIRAAQSVGTTTAGGFTVPQGFYAILEDALKAFGGMREVSTILATDTGASIPMPTDNDTSQVGELLGENVAAAEQDVVFGSLTMDAFMYSSKIVRVSLQLMQDSAFDMATFLAGKLAERIGRITNTHFTIGTGTGQPRGVVVAATLGKTGIAGQTLSVIYGDLVDLEHSVDPAYRRRPSVRWMMHDSSLKVIKKLVDGQSRPLWLPGLAVQAPDTILGYPYAINQDVAVMAANAKSILFGDFSKYYIRVVRDLAMMQLRERYAEFLQVGFLGFQRFDGDLLDAGTNPIKYYANSAT